MKQKQIFLILCVLLVNLFGKTWRDFPRHYKAMAYASFVNGLYYCVCRRHLVWEFTPNGVNWRFLRVAHVIFVTPLIVLLFLAKCPNKRVNQIIYTIKATLLAGIAEYFIHKQKMIQFKHGWSTLWSSFMYFLMFTYSALFNKRPLVACLLSIYTFIFFITKFKVPIKTHHPFSRKCDAFVDLFYHTFLEDLF